MENKLTVCSSPHLHGGESVSSLMLDVIIALIPAAAASVWLFGWKTLGVIAVCVASCVAFEFLSCVVLKKKQTVGDLSCVVTGMLLALNLPPTVPLWEAVIGCAAAIVVAKEMFGGIGQNFINPALCGRIVLLMSFPGDMNTWINPIHRGLDTVTTATPLTVDAGRGGYDISALFFGMHGGSLGETCAAALILGGLYLIVRRVITPTVPVVMVGTVFLCEWIATGSVYEATCRILSGGLLLGAIFMATDYTTSPLTGFGRVIYALGCGLLTELIRRFGSLPEGVSFAIVIMNILVPLIDRIPVHRVFGQTLKRKKEVAA